MGEEKQKLLVKAVEGADQEELDAVMKAIVRRYGELFPDWEVYFITMHRDAEKRKKDLKELVSFLESVEEHRKTEEHSG